MLISPGTTVVVSQNLAVADLGDEAVLLDPNTGNYFGLNEVAARILELAASETTVDRIVKALLDEYDVDRARLEADVAVFVKDLEAKGLLSVR
ncbi:MAG: PqqD family protein [Bacteroidota bacterium]